MVQGILTKRLVSVSALCFVVLAISTLIFVRGALWRNTHDLENKLNTV